MCKLLCGRKTASIFNMSVRSMDLDAKVDLLEKLLREKAETLAGFCDEATQCHELNKIFRFFNTDKDGWMSFPEFNAALVRLNFVGKQDEVAALFERYDTDGCGYLSYEEFSAGLFGLIPNCKGTPDCRSTVSRIRNSTRQAGDLLAIRRLAGYFQDYDRQGEGKLTRDELRAALRDFGVQAGERDINILFKHFDRQGEDTIDYDELIIALRGNLSSKRRQAILGIFQKMDKGNTGEVSTEELGVHYNAKGDPEVQEGSKSEQEALEEFLSNWMNVQNEGVVTKAEFLDFYKDISGVVEQDEDFRRILDSMWHFENESHEQ